MANTNINNRMALEMLMDPTDHNIIIAATNDGIWRTINGGNSWTNVKNGGAFRDMKQRPNSNTLYAVTESACWISNDFGITWNQVTAGLSIPAGTDGLRLGVSAADNNIVYIIANGGNGVIFKSTNAGLSFVQTYSSTTQCIVCYDNDPADPGQGNYNLGLCADPFDANHVYVVAHCLWESNDGGISFEQKTEWYAELHTDHHQVEVNPYDVNQLWDINDGGVWLRSGTNDSLWDTKSDGIGATEIYKAAQSPVNKNIVSIGTQDNGELYYDGIWKTNRGGDWGSRVNFDYSPESTIYYLENGERRPFAPYGGGNGYNSPFTPTNASRIAFHKNQLNLGILARDTVFRTINLGDAVPTWTNIFNTTNDIRDLTISSADSSIAYIISDNNKFTRIKNLLSSPLITNSTTPNSTASRGSVAAVKNNVNVVYISCDNKVYRSSDQGTTWTNISFNLPGTNILKIYHDDFSTDETVYVCTGNMVFTKNISAANWTDITFNLPSIANITDFMIYNSGTIASKLRVSYYGRGVWEYALHPNYLPVADFNSNNSYICPGQSVQFNDLSDGDNLIYSWSFPGGVPTSSSLQNPLISYPAAGTYSVTLTVTNANGSDVKTINSYIFVGSTPAQIISEGFQGTGFPPPAWSLLDDGNDGINWFKSSSAGGFGGSNRSIAFDNYNNDTQGNQDQIQLTIPDLSSFSSAKISFDVAYAPYSTTAYLDSLLVGISTDCGVTFTYVYTKYGNSLATAPVNTGSTFVPLATQWRKDTILLNNYLNASNVLVAFENRGRFGQQIFIDNINLLASPNTQFTANDTTICAGSSINFTDESTGLVNSWNWSFPGGTPSSSTLQNNSVTYDQAGIFDVSLMAGNGSASQIKNKPGYVKVLANPLPVINVSDPLLTCNLSSQSYQWFLNNDPIPGATQQSYTSVQDGAYTVSVVDANGCVGTSVATTLPLATSDYDGILVYPIPSPGIVTITSKKIKGTATLRLYNAAGALVMNKTINDISNKNDIDISNLPAAVYELKLITESGVFVKKIQRAAF